MEDLIKDFETTSVEQWKQQLEKDLKGITFDELQKIDDNGIVINPFYNISDITSESQSLFKHTDWIIVEKIIVENETDANAKALLALSLGANGLHFVINNEKLNWATLFQNIELNIIETTIEFLDNINIENESLSNYLKEHEISTLNIKIVKDRIAQHLKDNLSINIELLSQLSNNILFIDGAAYYNSGANSTTQLAFTIAQIQEYYHVLNEKQLLASVQQVVCTVALGTAFFEEIAKLRALRQLVNLLNSTYNVTIPLIIQVETGVIYKAPYDVYSNLLRDTLVGLAAVMGGCNTLFIASFDQTNEKGNEKFSRRMSINQQLIFKEESYLSQIADVASGSFYLEKLTQTFAEKAWQEFKTIELEGGLINYFASGKMMPIINNQAQQLIDDYVSGKKVWIGVNKYPNATESPKAQSAKSLNTKNLETIDISSYILLKN